ncbi:MAG: hypothetical protein JO267_10590 [Alphaproteobacteria bacterium]|nr:hypothetical protein [Alphaproteobacteria bacterium]
MDVYHVWFNLKDGVRDLDFVAAARAYLDQLREGGLLAEYRITRCKLGLAPPQLREWHITLEFTDLGQLDRAFQRVSARTDPVEGFHHAVNSKVRDVFFALYRDFPDPQRVPGNERF